MRIHLPEMRADGSAKSPALQTGVNCETCRAGSRKIFEKVAFKASLSYFGTAPLRFVLLTENPCLRVTISARLVH